MQYSSVLISPGQVVSFMKTSASAPTRTASNRKPQGRDEIVEAVLQAAEKLFSERPFKEVTTREIADAANVNLGLNHRHLGSKEELLERVIASFAERFRLKALEAPDPSAAPQYLAMTDRKSNRLNSSH